MTDGSDPEATLEEWKDNLHAEHEAAIRDPDPDADHRIEGVAQITYRVYYRYDEESGDLERTGEEKVDDLTDPDLRSCSCGVRGMTPEEARTHVEAARERE